MSAASSKSTNGVVGSGPGRPQVFLELYCPVQEVGIECRRERSTGLQPPDKRLHVWWARRPLTVSRLSVLGSVLPADFDQKSFLRLNGILGDPVAGRKKIDEVQSGIRKERVKNPYGYPRAFSNPIPGGDVLLFRKACKETWGTATPTVLDSFAGGGSIPLEAYRLGLPVILNELNPVAVVVEKGTLEYPALFGSGLSKDIQSYGQRIAQVLERKISQYFPRQTGEVDLCYIWVRTVLCKDCGLHVPLSPNWWVDVENKLGYRFILPHEGEGNECTFQIVKRSGDFDPEKGTVARGAAVCPRCSLPLDEDYIKGQAQAGRMGQQLAVVGFKKQGQSGRFFRPPTDADLKAVDLARKTLEETLPIWRAKGIVPEEEYPETDNDPRPRIYGMKRWCDFFSPRQLMVHLVTLETILGQPWEEVKDSKKREALRVCMAFALDKCLNYNSQFSVWHPGQALVMNTFKRHDFAFLWTFGEAAGDTHFGGFGIPQVLDAYSGIAELLGDRSDLPAQRFRQGDARSLTDLRTGEVDTIVIDPPYEANVMYAELADFFYVWMKRSLGDVFPDLFISELTDKEDEAVANVARFKSAHRGKARQLATSDYEAKMQAAFAECYRVLRDDGVMTVMFTHKKVAAWDALAAGLFEAGFEITASWPVHTESEHSLHQAKKNAAASTILLVCRKRSKETKGAWWEDLQEELDRTVHSHAEEYLKRGMKGQDIFIATFGPALKVVSASWPVRTKDGKTIRPDDALNRARKVVANWYLDKIAEGKGQAIDAVTRFYILAWHVFQAREFPFDEARKLALSLGVEVDHLTSRYLLEKRSQGVRIVRPEERVVKRTLRLDDKGFDWDVDYVEAAIATYQDGKGPALARFHARTGALQREGYRATIGLLLDVLPRAPEVTEFPALEGMWQSALQTQVPRRARTDPTGEMQSTLEEHDESIDEDQADQKE